MFIKFRLQSSNLIAIALLASLFVKESEGDMHTLRNRSHLHDHLNKREVKGNHNRHLHRHARQNLAEGDDGQTTSLDSSFYLSTPSITAVATTTTSSSSSGPVTANPATLPTPMTTSIGTTPIPLYVPPFDPLVDPGKYDVKYFGPGNGRSTVYEVVYKANANRGPVTATMVADASDAKLFGAQQTTIIDGQPTQVWAAVSCGFADGLEPTVASPAAGYCIYYNNNDHVTSTWTTAITQIQAQTTITPSPGAVDSSIASFKSVHGDFAKKPLISNNSQSINFPSSNQLFIILISIIVSTLLTL